MQTNSGTRTCIRCGNISPLSMNVCPKCGLGFATPQQSPSNLAYPTNVHPAQSPFSAAPANLVAPITSDNDPEEHRGWPLILEPHDLTEWVAAWVANWIWLSFGVIMLVLFAAAVVRIQLFTINEVLFLGMLFALIATFPLYYVLKLRRLFTHSAIAKRHNMQDVGLWLFPLLLLSLISVYLFFMPVSNINPTQWNQSPSVQQPTSVPQGAYNGN